VNEGSDSDSDVDDDVVARAILLKHRLLPRPTAAQLAVALELVALDPQGSRALAFGTPPPPGREDGLTAPALGVYLAPLKPLRSPALRPASWPGADTSQARLAATVRFGERERQDRTTPPKRASRVTSRPQRDRAAKRDRVHRGRQDECRRSVR